MEMLPMAAFQFKYMTLLDYRTRIEEERQRELAQVLRMRMILHDQLRQMQQTIHDSKQALSESLSGKVDVQKISHFARYSGQVERKGHDLILRLSQLEKKIDHARRRLLDATRQRKALELLRDRHREQWQAQQDRREAVEMDELATQQYLRRMAVEVAR